MKLKKNAKSKFNRLKFKNIYAAPGGGEIGIKISYKINTKLLSPTFRIPKQTQKQNRCNRTNS